MGYFTSFNLSIYKIDDGKIDTSYNDYDLIDKLISSNQDYNDHIKYAISKDGDSLSSCKWYEHEEDMKIYSELQPDVVFELSGTGEEDGDMWVKYFHNGKMQICPAIITYDEFDINKIK